MGRLVEISWADARWKAIGLKPLAKAAAKATLRALGLNGRGHQISILACDDARIAGLNAQFRARLGPTNVLSWPAANLGAVTDGAEPEPPGPQTALGDVAIAWETCAREAAEQGKSIEDHVTHLIVHGTLHLVGYDHVRDRDAALMEGLEVRILASLGLADPYRQSVH